MRKLRPFSAAMLLALVPAWAGASPFLEAAEFLDGSWRGDDFVLRVDSHRAQASVDPKRPFEWDRFVIREVTDEEVIFVIGAELFEAKRRDEQIVLTGTSFQGKRILEREGPPALRRLSE